jgi:murein DD-endopeptidase MepM/ murein hydrolase activator NlpD
MDSSNPSKDVLQSYQRLGSNFGGPNREYPDHSGIDEDCNNGDPVYSTFDGTVSGISTPQQPFRDWTQKKADECGNCVAIDPSSPYGTRAWFQHLLDIVVREGQTVKVGDLIGHCDHTGTKSGSAPHLHYEVDCTAGTPDCRCAPNPDDPTKQGCVRDPETVHPCGS